MPNKLPYVLGGVAVVTLGAGLAWYLSKSKKAPSAHSAQPQAAPSPKPPETTDLLWKPGIAPPGLAMPGGLAMPASLPPIPQGFGAPPALPSLTPGIPSLTPGTSEPGIAPGGGYPATPYQVPPTASADLLAMAQNMAKSIKTTGMTGNRWSGPGGDHMGNHRSIR